MTIVRRQSRPVRLPILSCAVDFTADARKLATPVSDANQVLEVVVPCNIDASFAKKIVQRERFINGFFVLDVFLHVTVTISDVLTLSTESHCISCNIAHL